MNTELKTIQFNFIIRKLVVIHVKIPDSFDLVNTTMRKPFYSLRINFYLLRTFCPHLGRPEVKFGRNIVKEEITQKLPR